jgi:hypothetical protein
MVVARAALEACVISSWLNDPQIETEERIKRGLCEMLYSTQEVKRLALEGDDRSAIAEETWLRVGPVLVDSARHARGDPRQVAEIEPRCERSGL